MPKTRSEILSEQLLHDYEARVAAAGGHFKYLPLADDPVAVLRPAHERDTGAVPPPPSLADAIRTRRKK